MSPMSVFRIIYIFRPTLYLHILFWRMNVYRRITINLKSNSKLLRSTWSVWGLCAMHAATASSTPELTQRLWWDNIFASLCQQSLFVIRSSTGGGAVVLTPSSGVCPVQQWADNGSDNAFRAQDADAAVWRHRCHSNQSRRPNGASCKLYWWQGIVIYEYPHIFGTKLPIYCIHRLFDFLLNFLIDHVSPVRQQWKRREIA